jgi:hypothetical protein
MQALSISIGPVGIRYFAQKLVAGDLQNFMAQAKPPDNNLNVPDFRAFGFGWSASYSKINIQLRVIEKLRAGVPKRGTDCRRPVSARASGAEFQRRI